MNNLDRWYAEYDAEIQRHRTATARLRKALPLALAADAALAGAQAIADWDLHGRAAPLYTVTLRGRIPVACM